MTVEIRKIDINSSRQLAELFNKDEKLRTALGSSNRKINLEEFINKNCKWASKNNAEIFAIYNYENAVGMISLSHQDIENRTAQIGCWIGSQHWRKGITSKAFKKLLNYASKKGIKKVSAKIKKDNITSKKIWENNGAKIYLEDDYFKTMGIQAQS